MADFINKPAPAFEVTACVDKQEKTVKLEDYKGKWVLLFFYPLDFTFVCPTEILAFNKAVPEFEKLNTQVLGASTDSWFTHLAWINTPRKQGGLGDLSFPLLEDCNLKLSKAYNVLDEDAGCTYRGTYIIGPEGKVRHFSINDKPVGRNVEEYLRLVRAFQFNDKHGEVCPAGWQKEGDATIKDNPTDKLEYFEANAE